MHFRFDVTQRLTSFWAALKSKLYTVHLYLFQIRDMIYSFRLVERFQSDYQTMLQRRCLRIFGLSEENIGNDGRFFESNSFPRIAEVFLESMSDVSYVLFTFIGAKFFLG